MKPILAIDFGTTNTYISISRENGMRELAVFDATTEEVHGISSAILYYGAGERMGMIEIGQQAVNTYGPSSPSKREKNGLRLATCFKPRLHKSDKDQNDAENFLKELCHCLKETNKLPDDPSNMDVIFGVPCEMDTEFQNTLKFIAKNAGFGEIRLLPEPFGGIWYDWDPKNCSAEELLQKHILVIDFGGGTCDFALLQGGNIQKTWGNPYLGGCLFDDLFYQWLLDLTGKDKRLVEDHDYYWLFIKSRELKERFSNAMKKNKFRTFEDYILDTYEIELTWSEFEKRAQNYEPSSAFLKYSNDSGEGLRQHIQKDLLHWFQNSLMEGFEKNAFSSVDLVIFAGGSSHWPFVMDFCNETFGQSKIHCCSNVFAAISMGLGKYVLKKEEVEFQKERILSKKDDFIIEFLEKARHCLIPQDETGMAKQNEIIKQYGLELFQDIIQPELKNFQEKGGSVEDLEKQIVQNLNNHKTRIQECLRELFVQKNGELNQQLKDKLSQWLEIEPEKLKLDSNTIQLDGFCNTDENYETGIAEDLGLTIAGIITTALVAIIVASSTIGGPLAWAGAGILSLASGVIASTWASQTKWTPKWSSWLMDDKKIKTLRNDEFLPKFQERFEELYEEIVFKNQNEIETYLKSIIEKVISNYQKIINLELKDEKF